MKHASTRGSPLSLEKTRHAPFPLQTEPRQAKLLADSHVNALMAWRFRFKKSPFFWILYCKVIGQELYRSLMCHGTLHNATSTWFSCSHTRGFLASGFNHLKKKTGCLRVISTATHGYFHRQQRTGYKKGRLCSWIIVPSPSLKAYPIQISLDYSLNWISYANECERPSTAMLTFFVKWFGLPYNLNSAS